MTRTSKACAAVGWAVVLLASSCQMKEGLVTAARTADATLAAKNAEPSSGVVVTREQLMSVKSAKAVSAVIPITEEATGKVAFNDDAITPVFSPYTGRVIELLAKPGDVVGRGTPLLLIDSPEVVDAENDFLAGRAAWNKAQAILRQMERNRDRVQKLVSGEAAAPKDLEQALTDVESAKSDVRSTEAQIDAARQRLLNFGKTDAEIERFSETRRADRTTRVLTPIGGQIIGRKVGPGQYVRPDNPDPLFTISDTSSMWLLAQVYENQIQSVKTGNFVVVRVPALSGQVFHATVNYVAPTVDPATRRVAVRCLVQNRNNHLKPEMFVNFTFERASRRVIVVPQRAVVREGNLAVLWVLEGGDRVSRRPVEIGAEIDGRIEIKSGLREGETVVSDGALFLSSFVKG